MVPGLSRAGWGRRALILEKEKQRGHEVSLSLETGLGSSPNSVTHDSEEITLVSSIFSYSLIKGLSKVRSGKYKHSCCPPSPVF